MNLYNSKTQIMEKFVPFDNKNVKMYVCGITPYDTTHLGHAFTYIFFDVLIRYLKFKGYKVTYAQNVTDIDDDILKRAKEEGLSWKKLGDFWTKRFLRDMKALNVLPPTHYVKATDSITLMIRIIKVLIQKGFAYQKNGNVYFEIKKFKDYGKLSRLNKKQMILLSKERGANPDDPLKKNPLDFLLWQSASWRTKPNEPFWQSPWGKGRPGWHIECSAMVKRYLGERIDIHGGGHDLIFPHHESEIAQSKSFTGKAPFVRFWVHTAMLSYNGKKMAKSLGNLVMISDLLEKYSPNAIRFVLLSHHYRKPWEFNIAEVKKAEKILTLIYDAISLKSKDLKPINAEKVFKDVVSFMDEDLNTPCALFVIQSLAKRIIKERRRNVSHLQKVLKECLFLLGFTL